MQNGQTEQKQDKVLLLATQRRMCIRREVRFVHISKADYKKELRNFCEVQLFFKLFI